ncbi:hypothetical protein Ahy_B07g087591 [Arachis hypogaea]|uniref:Uncharacterized protein n=1 Tax=Arachis hypogaea TaxID=3818 RepID=A0A444YCI4_ARAHY|nr:hypothetical protein Ahy_B07g087591 [Arachis hypogaea]
MNMPRNMGGDIHFERDIPRFVRQDQNVDDVEVVKIAIMGLDFYMPRKLLNVHIPDLAYLAERFFPQKENVSYVEMESSSEKSDFELLEVDLAELKKGPPYVCSDSIPWFW